MSELHEIASEMVARAAALGMATGEYQGVTDAIDALAEAGFAVAATALLPLLDARRTRAHKMLEVAKALEE